MALEKAKKGLEQDIDAQKEEYEDKIVSINRGHAD
jgi:hypothetical protein